MKYERTMLTLHAGYQAEGASVQALRVGNWYVHRKFVGDGLIVSHRVGFRVASKLAPVKAVRVLRALQAVPPAPVTDGELWLYVGGQYPIVKEKIWPWKQYIREALASVGVKPAKGMLPSSLPEHVLQNLRTYGLAIVDSRYDETKGYWLYAVQRPDKKPLLWKAREGVEALIEEYWHADMVHRFEAVGWYLGDAPDGYVLAPVGVHNPKRRRGLDREHLITALAELENAHER